MKQIITSMKFKTLNMVLALVLVFIGLQIDLQDNSTLIKLLHLPSEMIAQIIRVAATVIFGVAGILTLIGKEGLKNLFAHPKKPVFYTIVGFITFYFFNTIMSLILVKVFKLQPAANTNTLKNVMPTIISLPFFMVFEEVWTMTMLFIVANLVYKKTQNFNTSFNIASLISAIVFAAAHWSAYFHGSVVTTLIQLTLSIGLGRVILNLLFKKSNTFTVPYLVHWAYDTLNFVLVLVLLKK